MKKYTFNENFFENIDNEQKAYFLGLLFSDGNIYLKRYRVQLTLANEDAYIIQEFAKAIEYNGNLYSDRNKYTKIILPSIKMCNDLITLGCIPNKSLSVKFPNNVNSQLIHHFIRGCFDGDGHVSKRNNTFNTNFTSSKDFIEELLKILSSLNIQTSNFRKRYIDKEISAYQLYIRANSAKLFFNYIYKDATIFLKRKERIANSVIVVKPIKKCNLCESKHFAKGFCKKHYRVNYFVLNRK